MTISALPTPPTRSDPTNFASRADAFLAALPTFADEANALAVAMNLNATTDTSSTSITIGTGSKSFTVSAGKSFQAGMYLVIADTAAPSTNSMWGQVTSYAGTALVMNIISVLGSGTKTAWTISQSAPNAEFAYATNNSAGKTTPVDADVIPLIDSAAGNTLKKLTWANLKATLATWIGSSSIAGAFTTLSSTGAVTVGSVAQITGTAPKVEIFHGTKITQNISGTDVTSVTSTGQTVTGHSVINSGALKVYGALDVGLTAAAAFDYQVATNHSRILAYGPSTTRGTLDIVSDVAGGGSPVIVGSFSGIGLALDSTISLWSGVLASGVIQLKNGTSLASHNSVASGYLTSNGYFDGTNWIRNNAQGAVQYSLEGTNSMHRFWSAASAASGSNITWTKSLEFGLGNTVALQGASSNSGAGISFPATQSASTDANTLDDYEEGTWTPTQGAGITVVGTFSSNGSYTKVGRQVTVNGQLNATTSLSCGVAALLCNGLPFTTSTYGGAAYYLGAGTNGGNNTAMTFEAFSSSIYANQAISATPSIVFTVTYFV